MKKIITLLSALFITANILAQAPQKMTYQAVIRNASNNLVTSSSVGMRLSVLQGTNAVYVETQTPSTNANGLVSLEIGTGTVVTGNFSTINWGAGPYFVKTETDPTGGTSYSITGTSQLNSVPYALYAGNVVNYTAGAGIAIAGGTITNTAPSPKIVRGTSTGGFAPTIINGSGFSAVRLSMGTYVVTFATPFTTAPTVVGSVYNTNNPQIWIDEAVKISGVSTTGFTIYTGTGAGSPLNANDGIPFSFIAIGD